MRLASRQAAQGKSRLLPVLLQKLRAHEWHHESPVARNELVNAGRKERMFDEFANRLNALRRRNVKGAWRENLKKTPRPEGRRSMC